jgi:pimeloyl-ACP methyl ester carboxylesterase
MTISQFPPLQFPLPKGRRHLAYSAVGEANSAHVLLCLPGLLETRATFDPLLQAAQGVHGLRAISLDLCGRGDSSQLPGDQGYTMQVYLEDVAQFMRQALMPEGQPMPRIDVLGTSMGGILAMYLASDAHNHVHGLYLNDIGLDLPWMSIYGLYDGMKKQGRAPTPEEMAAKYNVSMGAALAVQSPSHFDLAYRKDWKGMKFGHLLNGFKGPVHLMHGSDSGVCTQQQVKELRSAFPNAKVLEVAGAAHPVPFNSAVNQFVLRSLNLPDAPVVKPESVSEVVAPIQMQLVMPLETPQVMPHVVPQQRPDAVKQAKLFAEPLPKTVPKPVATQLPPVDAAPKPRVGLVGLIKQLLGATKR